MRLETLANRRSFLKDTSRYLLSVPILAKAPSRTPLINRNLSSFGSLPDNIENLDKEVLYPDHVRLAILADSGTSRTARDVRDQVMKLDPRPSAVIIAGDSVYFEHKQSYESLLEMWDGTEIFAVDGERDRTQQFLQTFALRELFHTRRFGPVELFGLSNVDKKDYPFEIQIQKLIEAIANSKAPVKIGVMHHPPFCVVDRKPEYKQYRFPYKQMGLHAVVSGDFHGLVLVERDIPYFTVGTGGQSLYSISNEHKPEGTKAAFGGENGDFGFLLLDVKKTKLKLREDSEELTDAHEAVFTFITRSGDTGLFTHKMTVI